MLYFTFTLRKIDYDFYNIVAETNTNRKRPQTTANEPQTNRKRTANDRKRPQTTANDRNEQQNHRK
jgi:hypothetical protein